MSDKNDNEIFERNSLTKFRFKMEGLNASRMEKYNRWNAALDRVTKIVQSELSFEHIAAQVESMKRLAAVQAPM